jgi:hypothetical protein
MNLNIQYSASVTIDGEVRSVSGNETIEANSMTTGSQTIGNSYELLAGSTTALVGLLLYNAGTVDVSVRLTLLNYTTKQYVFLNLIAGGVMCIGPQIVNDAGVVTDVVGTHARTASGTAIVEYCHIY